MRDDTRGGLMKKIIEYGIVRHDDTQQLANHIAKAIEKGYQPLGGVAYLPNGRCAQAYVRYEEEITAQDIAETRPPKNGEEAREG
jgi:hypothetical protein